MIMLANRNIYVSRESRAGNMNGIDLSQILANKSIISILKSDNDIVHVTSLSGVLYVLSLIKKKSL